MAWEGGRSIYILPSRPEAMGFKGGGGVARLCPARGLLRKDLAGRWEKSASGPDKALLQILKDKSRSVESIRHKQHGRPLTCNTSSCSVDVPFVNNSAAMAAREY